MNFYDLLELSQLRAIHAAIEPTLDSVWRMKLRQYSREYHTPLHICEELDPMKILQALNEDKYHPSIVDEELEQLLETLHKMKDPTWSSISKEELEDLVDAVINKELSRASKKKPPTPATIQQDIKAAELKPKSGGMNFDDLQKIDSESESGKSGF